MRAYHKINPAIWRDEKVRAFTDDGQLAWIYMLTHPTLNALGVLPVTIEGLAAERRWTPARFRKAIATAIAQDMLELDEAAGYIGFRNWLKHNEPEGPNAVSAWLKALEEIPECPAKHRLIVRCRAYLEQKAPTWKDREKSVKPEVWDAFTVDPSPHHSQEPSPHPSPHPSQDGSCTRAGTSASASATATTTALPPYSPPKGGRPSATPGFDQFWDSYPKKRGHDDALTVWRHGQSKAGHPIPPVEIVLAALERAKASDDWAKDHGQYIPNPATWLRQGRWQDEPRPNGHDPRRVNDAWADEPKAQEAGS
jgi:hypothetical protein